MSVEFNGSIIHTAEEWQLVIDHNNSLKEERKNLQEKLISKDKSLNSLRKQLSTVVEHRDEIKTMNKAYCDTINKLNDDIKELNKHIANDTSTIAEKDNVIKGLQARIAELAHKEHMSYHNSKQEFTPNFKPFDKVIVSNDNTIFYYRHFSKLCPDSRYPYLDTCETGWKYCKHYIETE